MASIAAVIVAGELSGKQRRRRLEVSGVVGGAVVGLASSGYGLSAARPVWMVVGSALLAVAGVAAVLCARDWVHLGVDGRTLFHGLSSCGRDTQTREGTLTEGLLAELRARSDTPDDVVPTRGTHIDRIPYPTSVAIEAHLDALAALDLHRLPARALSAGQLAPLAQRWLARVLPDCAQAAEALATTAGYRDATIGEVASAAARAMRETPPKRAADSAGKRRQPWTAHNWRIAVVSLLAGVVAATCLGGVAGVYVIVDRFGSKQYEVLNGRLDLTSDSHVAGQLHSIAPDHLFLVDDEGRVVVVDDAGHVLPTDADNRPVDDTASGTLVAVAVDPDAIAAGRTDVYRTDDGGWTTARSAAAYRQERPSLWAVGVLLTAAATAVALVAPTAVRLCSNRNPQSRW